MKKIAILTTTIYPDLWGGELYMLNLAKEFAKKYDVTVLCISFHEGVRDCEIDGVKIKYLPKWNIWNKYFPSLVAMTQELKKINPDIIYSSSPGILDFWLVFLNLFFRKKLAMTYHGSFSSEVWYTRWFMKLYFAIVFRFYSTIIVTTQKYYQLLKKAGVKGVFHVPCGVEEEKIAFDPNSFQKNNKLLFVAMLTSKHLHKRLPILLEAMKELPEFELDILGEGDMRATYEAQAVQLGLKNVVFHGAKQGEELLNFYKNASIFILPSNSEQEGFWIVLLEALGNGTKIIVGERCGGAFLINEEPSFGSTYDGEVSSLVATVKKVAAMEVLDYQKTKTLISSYFWDNIAARILEKIESLWTSKK